jgi:hypothetical protein
MPDDVDKFRKQEDECREQAERAINPLDKERWLRLAGDWTKMAREAEAVQEGGPQPSVLSCERFSRP